MKKIFLSFLIIFVSLLFFNCSEDSSTEPTNGDDGKVYYEGGPHTDSKGEYYTTIKIGDQVWLKENLNIGSMIVSNDRGDIQRDNGILEKYCFENNEANCETYGGLYQWDEAMKYSTEIGAQGICPDGWHIPTNSEWWVLEEAVDSSGNALKAGDGDGMNTSGFSALLSGARTDTDGKFYSLGTKGLFWSAQGGGSYCFVNILSYYNDDISIARWSDNGNGYSIRCLKD